jgi:hypothetical protein
MYVSSSRSIRGGGVRGFGSPSGWGGSGGPLFLFCSIVGESDRIGGGAEDSVRIVGWSGVFSEVVEAFRTLSGFSNGLLIVVELECEDEVLNRRFMVGVVLPEGGGVRSRSSRGTSSSFSLSGSTWWCSDRGRWLRSPAQIELAVRVTPRTEYLTEELDSRATLLRSRSSASHLRRVYKTFVR